MSTALILLNFTLLFVALCFCGNCYLKYRRKQAAIDSFFLGAAEEDNYIPDYEELGVGD